MQEYKLHQGVFASGGEAAAPSDTKKKLTDLPHWYII